MKNANYYLAILFAVTLVFTSCKKDDIAPTPTPDPITPTGIQPKDLVGDWNFVSLEVDGQTYTANTYCDDMPMDNYGKTVKGFKMSWLGVTTSTLNEHDLCDRNGYYRIMNYTIVDNVITMNTEMGSDWNKTKYKIVNADTFNGTLLKLELIDNGGFPRLSLNSIYTLHK